MTSMQHRTFITVVCLRKFLLLGACGLTASLSFDALAGERIWVPVRWCGVEGAPSMVNPGVVNEATTDDVLWRRHERPTDAIYHDLVGMTFRSGATAAIKNGPQSFPIIRDPSGSGGDLINSGENTDAVTLCRRVWAMGDPLYFDQNNNNIVNDGIDTLLSSDIPMSGFVSLGHQGATLNPAPGDVRFVDLDTDGNFDVGERIYRDENTNGVVDPGDTLLVETAGTTVGDVEPADLGATLLSIPGQVKYLDLIRRPVNTFNIGYPAVQGVTAVSANDVEFTSIAFPVHGVAATGLGGLGVAMDDPSQYLPPGPDFTLFETQLVAHEFGHSFGLSHGDGIDDNMDGILDNRDDPRAPVPGADLGTLCDSNNVMQYCWLDNGTSGNPDLVFIGVGTPTFGSFTTAQSDVIRNFVLTNVSDRIVDPVAAPLDSTRVDNIGEVKPPFEHIDIAEFSVRVDAARANTIFSLQTRRAFPADTQSRVDFHFLIDIDGNRKTGAPPELLKKFQIPSDFVGADYASSLRLRGLEVIGVTLLKYDPRLGDFVEVPSDRIRGTRDTLNLIPDFPFGRRTSDPDDFDREGPFEIPAKEIISVIVPRQILAIPANTSIRVEYLSHDVESDTIDRARSRGLDFSLPVFPECRTEPGTVRAGELTTVVATGLLPNRAVHLLLGDTELASGVSDATGLATISMSIPRNAKLGERLVTVGALAVSADCSVTVKKVADGGALPDEVLRMAKFSYAAKFVCGRSSETLQEGVVKGVHRTLITLHNPSFSKKVRYAKKVARALPNQSPGFVSPFEVGTIAPNHSIAVECDEIRRMLPLPMTSQFRSGYLVILTDDELDVTAMYTGRPGAGEVSTMDTQVIEPRKIKKQN